jgi:hypothetical protein
VTRFAAVAAFGMGLAIALVMFVGSRDGSAAVLSAVPATPALATARAMPHVVMPSDFTLPDSCSLSEGGVAVRTGENGSVIHWIAVCPRAEPAEISPLFGSALAKQGWTQTQAPAAASHQVLFRRGDLELVFEFVAPGQPATNYVWFAERYWR